LGIIMSEIGEIRLGPLSSQTDLGLAAQELADKENEIIRELIAIASREIQWDDIKGKPIEEAQTLDPILWVNIEDVPTTLEGFQLLEDVMAQINDNLAVHNESEAAHPGVIREGDSRLTDARTPVSHNHDDLYYTKIQADDQFLVFADDATVGNLFITGDEIIIENEIPTTINLDADKLDAQHGSHYLNRANHTGAQGPESLSGGTAGRLLRDNGSGGAWSSLTIPDTVAAGAMLYASAADTFGPLAIGAADQVLVSNGSAPIWAANLPYATMPNGAGTWVGTPTISGKLTITSVVSGAFDVRAPDAGESGAATPSGALWLGNAVSGIVAIGAQNSGITHGWIQARARASASFNRLALNPSGGPVLIGASSMTGVSGLGDLGVAGNLGLRTGSFGSGTGVLGIANASVVPSINPTGGGVLYVEAGVLKYRGSGGTVTTLAVA
jgi:hypothetical protein